MSAPDRLVRLGIRVWERDWALLKHVFGGTDTGPYTHARQCVRAGR